jgi:hypothetical protein
MVTVQPAPAAHYPWLAQRAHLIVGSQFRAIEAIDGAGRIVAMVGYDGWTESAVSMHVTLEYPAALRRILRPAFGIPFVELGKKLVLCQVLSTNAQSLALVKGVGFRQVYRGRDWWADGVDLVFFEMRKKDCRWVE